MAKRASFTLIVHDLKNPESESVTYPSLSLCAMDLRIPYPTLCYRLGMASEAIIYDRWKVVREETDLDPSRPLAVQCYNLKTGKTRYHHTVGDAAKFLRIKSADLQFKLDNTTRFTHVNEWRVYLIH